MITSLKSLLIFTGTNCVLPLEGTEISVQLGGGPLMVGDDYHSNDTQEFLISGQNL